MSFLTVPPPGMHAAVAALSMQLSTAALDKNPQSQERGITLDLGFSSFTVPLPERLRGIWPCRHAPQRVV